METDGLTLREATLSDAGDIHQITSAAFEEHRHLLDPPSGVHRETRESVEDFLRESGAILALMDGMAVGAVRYQQRDGGSLYVGRLAVLPSHRRRGIGRALMAAVEEKARRMGLNRMILGVRDELPQNRAFYESLGYRTDGQWSHPGYTRATVFFLSKTLET